MFNLMIILLSTINSEPINSNNYKIAKYIIEHIQELEDCTISELAKNCYVSNSSVSRFCRDIGLEDFNDLRMQVAKAPLAYKDARNKFEFKEFSDDFYSSYILSVTENLKHAFKAQEIQSQVESLVADLHHYKKVAAFGYMQSENIALHLQYDLQTSGKPVFTSIKFANQVEYIKEAGVDTLIIIFSDSGTYFDRVFSRTHPYKHTTKKPKICMITSNRDIRLSYVDQYIYYNSRKDYASHPYPLMMIADMICIQYAKSCHAN